MIDRFRELPWFLKEYVYENRWSGFRDVQVKAFDVLFGGDDHLLISSGTSSGKTEAAMFPVVSSLYNNRPCSVGALYVGPLKALIDDQFSRLTPMLKDSYITVTGWHGDVSREARNRLIDNPSGILQITPESLQNIIATRTDDLERLFGDLRFIIIDEVHAFMDSDRGSQLLCCLGRLEAVAGCEPRRIGLSATVADVDSAADWISADTGRSTSVVSDDAVSDRMVDIRYFQVPVADPDDDGLARKKAVNRYYQSLYGSVRGRNCIVFTNSRSTAEKTARSLSVMCRAKGDPDNVSVHHGSISREYRMAAESALKDRFHSSITVATVTLELGIDVGGLDTVVHVGPPVSCSSLVQRLGRTGRRGGHQSMELYCIDDDAEGWAVLDGVSMNLVKAVAITTLTLNDRWTEPARADTMPFGLLFHQTLEYMRSGIGCRFSSLVSDVLSLYPFRNISKEDYAVLVKHMISSHVILKMGDGTLLLDDGGERMTFDREFCSVFTVRREIDVRFEGKSVGSIQNLPEKDDLIQLAGRVWAVVDVDRDGLFVDVVESDGSTQTVWRSSMNGVHTRVMQRMRDVLFSDEEYRFLDSAARSRLNTDRAFARAAGMDEVFHDAGDRVVVYPWVGSVAFDTLYRVVSSIPEVSHVSQRPPYRMDVFTRLSVDDLRDEVMRRSRMDPGCFITPEDRLIHGKYDVNVPESLLMKGFKADRMDFSFRDHI